MAALRMYDLAAGDEARRFSPFCWRARFALAHKRLPVETIPWRFTDKAVIAEHGSERVPVLIDGDTAVPDSWRIAEYLEDTYPDRPSLFGGSAGRGLARAMANWVELVLHPLALRLRVGDIYAIVHEKDRAYFRQSREARLGSTLEQLSANAPANLEPFRQALAPVRTTIEQQPFLSGPEPLYADYVVCAMFQWIAKVNPAEVLDDKDPIKRWRADVLQRFEQNLAASR